MQGAMTSVFLLLSFVSSAALHLRTKPLKLKGEEVKWREARKPVFYMTAMGKLASKHQTRLWLASIRQAGKWAGEIVMVTDQAECLAKNLVGLIGEKNQNKSHDSLDVYYGGDQIGHIYMVKVATTTDIKEMKHQKALAWNNIRVAGLKPKYIVHTDQDIVFGHEVKEFLQNVDVLASTDAIPLLALFDDQGKSKGQLHTGIVVMFPGSLTETCLKDWGAKILTQKSGKYHGLYKDLGFKDSQAESDNWSKTKKSKSASGSVSSITTHGDFDGLMTEEAGAQIEGELFGPDQKALGKTASCKVGNGIVKMPAQYLLMPTSGSLSKGARATFIHFTNTNRWKSIKDTVMQKYFTSVLGLDANMDYFAYENCAAP